MATPAQIPIAVVGMSCRFPAGANDPEKFWSLLAEGKSTWSEVPSDRFNWKSFYHPSVDMNGAVNHRGGHFLDQDVSSFDASFFGIPTSEANAMDPQQRLRLESAYEALENAGLLVDQLKGSRTGVYVALFSRDYDRLAYKDPDDFARYHMTGAGDAIASNRVSYTFDLKGPSMTIDTGCSGSLVALHSACQSLRTGETDMSLVGGTNLILSPDPMVPMSLLHVLNSDGKCFAFDSRGAGYGRGEGVATLVLKRIDDALQANDCIRAVIRHTGVNQDGKTAGIFVPNQLAQESLVHEVYSGTNLDPKDVQLVEAHGTGTLAGDTTEMRSISNVFCRRSERRNRLLVGSVKSNIGHLESASGLAGVIKTILSLEKGLIPPSINLEEPKAGLKDALHYIDIPHKLEAFPANGHGTRLASVNSFGYGGTNAHVILEGATPTIKTIPAYGNGYAKGIPRHVSSGNWNGNGHSHTKGNGEAFAFDVISSKIKPKWQNLAPADDKHSFKPGKTSDPWLIVATAKSERSLSKQIGALEAWLLNKTGDKSAIGDLAYTLNSRRSHMLWRCSFIAETCQDLPTILTQRAFKISKTPGAILPNFIFTGQGAQWHAMGRELIRAMPIFQQSLMASEIILQELGSKWSLVTELLRDEATSNLGDSSIAQPATTAIQIALVDLLASLGIRPVAVLGHSSGEIAAAYTCGALSHSAALSVSYHRGFIARACKQAANLEGAMLAVGLGVDDVKAYIGRLHRGTVSVACDNSAKSTTISGDKLAIEELKENLDAQSTFAKILNVEVAYHSHHMNEVALQYLEALDGLEFGLPLPSVKFYSSVTACEKTSAFGPSYWVQNLTSQVRYSEAFEQLCRYNDNAGGMNSTDTAATFIEIGPHCALAGPTKQLLNQINTGTSKMIYIPSLVKNISGFRTLLALNGRLFELGHPISFSQLMSNETRSQNSKVVHDLPAYQWDHSSRYWHESRSSREHRLRNYPYHDLLGTRIPGGTPMEPGWRSYLSIDKLPWLQDHMVDDSIIFPGSGYLCMAIEAMRQDIATRHSGERVRQYVLRDIVFSKALLIPTSPGKIEAQFSLRLARNSNNMNSTGWADFRVCSLSRENAWHLNCWGSITVEYWSSLDQIEQFGESDSSVVLQPESGALEHPFIEQYSSHELYRTLRDKGNAYGPTFATMDNLRISNFKATGTVTIPDIAKCMPSGYMQPHLIHPATLDAFLHASMPMFSRCCCTGSVMPLSIEELIIPADITGKPGHEFNVTTEISPTGPRSASTNVLAYPTAQIKDTQPPPISISAVEICSVGEVLKIDSNSLKDRSITYLLRMGLDSDFITPEIVKASGSPAQELEEASSAIQKADLLDYAATLYIQKLLDSIRYQHPSSIDEHFIHLLNWMRSFSDSDKYKQSINIGPDKVADILYKSQQSGVEGEALHRLGQNLELIIKGALNPLDLLLEKKLLYRLYADEGLLRCYSYLAEYGKHFAFKNPNMRVLEIGAGTGGATLPLLQSFTNQKYMMFGHYDFTDISPSFFEPAKGKLTNWLEKIIFKTLNIEQDPISQGFEAETYDLVIASNVIHATQNIGETLANIRKLLKPGGQLAFIEVTNLRPSKNVIFGLLPGWWKGVDDGRSDSPLLSVASWNDVLLRQAFSGTDIVVKDFEGPANQMCTMFARSVSTSIPSLPPMKILCGPTESLEKANLSKQLLLSMREKGLDCQCTPWIVGPVSDDIVYVVLDSSDRLLLAEPTAKEFQQIRDVVTQAKKILWVTCPLGNTTVQDSRRGLITGFARAARSENQALQLITLDICQSPGQTSQPTPGFNFDIVSDVFAITFNTRRCGIMSEAEFTYRDGQLFVPRLIPDVQVNRLVTGAANAHTEELTLFQDPHRSLRLHVEKPGLLDSLIFVDNESMHKEIGDDELEMEAKAFGLNFKDVFIALGQMKGSTPMGGECAGIVTAVGSRTQSRFRVGDRICAWYATPYANRARVKQSFACQIPYSMSFVSAASIPVVFLTAYYGLVEIARLGPHQTVLIHSAAGGVGQAAIMIAKNIGATILATVGNSAKRQMLKEKFGIPEHHVFSSRTKGFQRKVLQCTGRKGADVVLNSLAGEALLESWDCIARFGTFIEIGKSDIHRNSKLSMKPFERNACFASLDLVGLADHRPEVLSGLLEKLLAMFGDGQLEVVLPLTTRPISQIESAFRLIQSSKHMGKVVLEAEEQSMVRAVLPQTKALHLDSNHTYAVAGGLGSLGRRVLNFLAEHGAKHLLVLSRRTLDDDDRQQLEGDLAVLGTKVYLERCDISNPEEMRDVAARCRDRLPSVKGVIQAAMVLQDRILEQMSVEDYKAAVRAKVDGTVNLNEIFESPSLEYFIMLSSIASVSGPRSQANYATGNTFQDQFAHHRANSPTHYISLNLGMIDESDIIALNPDLRRSTIRSGCLPLKLDQLFALLSYALSGQAHRDQQNQITIGFDRQSLAESSRSELLDTALFSHLSYIDDITSGEAAAESSKTVDRALASATSMEEIHDIMAVALVQQVSSLLAVDAESLNLDSPMDSLGLDSLIAIELKTWIARTLQAAMQTSEILDTRNLRALVVIAAQRSTLASANRLEDIPEKSKTRQVNGIGKAPADDSTATRLSLVPLQGLKATLEHFSYSIRPFCSAKEFEELSIAIQKFQNPGGLGHVLQSRLQQRAEDPQIDDWLYDLYTAHVYLKQRKPINPWGAFFGCHADGPSPQTQSERAAIIATATFQFKRQLESGQVEQQLMNGQPLCMDSLQWIFDSYRKPCAGIDKFNKAPSSDYFIAMRRGHYFKVPFITKGTNVLPTMIATFEAILRADFDHAPRVAALTADNRDDWAKVRKVVKQADPSNASLTQMIESSAFIICLDEASPETSTERANQFMWSDPANRWSDKSLQFAVCANGVSAYIVEHSLIDANTLHKLAAPIKLAIASYQRCVSPIAPVLTPQAHRFVSAPEIDHEIARVQHAFDANIISTEYVHTTIPDMGIKFLRAHGCAPNAAIQVSIQLASLRYFGNQPPSWETIAMSAFRKGRVELVQAVLPPVAAFCASMCDPVAGQSEQRARFDEAVTAYTSSVNRIGRGRGFVQHIYALKEMVRAEEGEEMPEWLGGQEGIFERTRPAKIMTDTSGWVEAITEGGYPMPDREHLWIHYEVGDNECRFAIKAPVGRTSEINARLQRAVWEIKRLLND